MYNYICCRNKISAISTVCVVILRNGARMILYIRSCLGPWAAGRKGPGRPPAMQHHRSPPTTRRGPTQAGSRKYSRLGVGGGGGGRRRDWGDGRGCCQFRSGLGPLRSGLLLTESCDLVMTPACHAVYCIGSSVYCMLLCCPSPRPYF